MLNCTFLKNSNFWGKKIHGGILEEHNNKARAAKLAALENIIIFTVFK